MQSRVWHPESLKADFSNYHKLQLRQGTDVFYIPRPVIQFAEQRFGLYQHRSTTIGMHYTKQCRSMVTCYSGVTNQGSLTLMLAMLERYSQIAVKQHANKNRPTVLMLHESCMESSSFSTQAVQLQITLSTARNVQKPIVITSGQQSTEIQACSAEEVLG